MELNSKVQWLVMDFMRGERRAAGRARTGAKLRGSGAKKVHYPLFTTEDSKVLPPFRGLPLPSRATTKVPLQSGAVFIFCFAFIWKGLVRT